LVWKHGVRGGVKWKKDDIQSGSLSWCTKCFSCQVVPPPASSRRL
jgi:hypothetical protein